MEEPFDSSMGLDELRKLNDLIKKKESEIDLDIENAKKKYEESSNLETDNYIKRINKLGKNAQEIIRQYTWLLNRIYLLNSLAFNIFNRNCNAYILLYAQIVKKDTHIEDYIEDINKLLDICETGDVIEGWAIISNNNDRYNPSILTDLPLTEQIRLFYDNEILLHSERKFSIKDVMNLFKYYFNTIYNEFNGQWTKKNQVPLLMSKQNQYLVIGKNDVKNKDIVIPKKFEDIIKDNVYVSGMNDYIFNSENYFWNHYFNIMFDILKAVLSLSEKIKKNVVNSKNIEDINNTLNRKTKKGDGLLDFAEKFTEKYSDAQIK